MIPVNHGPDRVAYQLDRDEGEALWMFDALDTIKAGAEHTAGSLTAVEFHDSTGSAPPLHIRERWDSGYYILDGVFDFVVADDRSAATTGAWIFVPRGTPHAWRCRSPQGRILNVTVPAGIDAFYRAVGQPVLPGQPLPPRRDPDVQALTEIAAHHGITIVGPPPSERHT